MNDAKLLRKKKGRSLILSVIAVLIVLEILAVSMILAQVVEYSKAPQRNYISLTKGAPNSTVQISKRELAASPAAGLMILSRFAPAFRALTSTGAVVYDEDQIWSTSTDINIFKIQYDNNGDMKYTVNSSNSDKVVAPGTENTYMFTLRNDAKQNMKYTLVVEASFSNAEYKIPVEAKLYDYSGKYIAGTADTWVPVLELNATEEGNLSAGNIADYTLRWQWPFERTEESGLEANDAYDTLLGNMVANGEDISLNITIRTIAEIDDDPGGENPPTGDDSHIVLFSAVAVVSLGGIVFLLVKKRKLEEE